MTRTDDAQPDDELLVCDTTIVSMLRYVTRQPQRLALRTLFGKFGVEDLPQNQKRVKLVEFALQSGTSHPAGPELNQGPRRQ